MSSLAFLWGPGNNFDALTRCSFSADKQRAKTASAKIKEKIYKTNLEEPIKVTGMPYSSAAIPVHLPVPF